jgi:hypothetical protein
MIGSPERAEVLHRSAAPDPTPLTNETAALRTGIISDGQTQARMTIVRETGRCIRRPAIERQGQIAVFLTFARCIRSHGFSSFPDPTSGGDLTHQMVAKAGTSLPQPAGDA